MLALLAERAAGTPYHDLVDELVCRPAGMEATAFLRLDELPGDAALGYLAADGLRTNVLHLPVRGTGDGGVFTTAADVHALWTALLRRSDRVARGGGRDGRNPAATCPSWSAATASASGSTARPTR